jgi:hypothetical protein
MEGMKSALPCPETQPPILCESQYRCFCTRFGLWDELSQLCPVHGRPRIMVRLFPTGDEAQQH